MKKTQIIQVVGLFLMAGVLNLKAASGN